MCGKKKKMNSLTHAGKVNLIMPFMLYGRRRYHFGSGGASFAFAKDTLENNLCRKIRMRNMFLTNRVISC